MSVVRIANHPRFVLARITGARRHHYMVSAGVIWLRYNEAKWRIIHDEELPWRMIDLLQQRAQHLADGNKEKAAYYAEHIMDLEVAIEARDQLQASAGGAS